MENINRSNTYQAAFTLHQGKRRPLPARHHWGRRQKIARSNPP